MNRPDQPLSPDTLDELLSADLDGELERAATELGFTPAEARAALDAAPGADLRRAELVAARDLLARLPSVDPAVELSLAAAAFDRSGHAAAPAGPRHVRSRTTWRVLVSVGSAAAVVAGIIALSAANPGARSNSKASTAPTESLGSSAVAADNAKPRLSIVFGDVSESRTLLAKVGAELNRPATPPHPSTAKSAADFGNADNSSGGASTTSPVGQHGPKGPQGATGALGGTGGGFLSEPSSDGVQGPAGNQGTIVGTGLVGGNGPAGPQGVVGSAGALRSANTATTCTAAIRRTARLPSGPVLAGSGADEGRRVFVVVFPQSGRYVVFVLAATDCSVVAFQTLS